MKLYDSYCYAQKIWMTFSVLFREFFARECGRNTVEFFKEDGKDQLYVALRFESKSIAKEVMERLVTHKVYHFHKFLEYIVERDEKILLILCYEIRVYITLQKF